MRKGTIFSSLLILIAASIELSGATIWKERNIYSSAGSVKQGDVVIVHVNDISKMQFNVRVKDDDTAEITSNPDMTITGFLPKANSSKSLSRNESTQINEQSNLQFTIAARIRKGTKDGMFQIAGTRIYTAGGITNSIQIAGIIDPSLIRGKKIDSSEIADFRLIIRKRKKSIDIKRDKLKEDEKAEVTLTEEEKQELIIDYLKKMLREITK